MKLTYDCPQCGQECELYAESFEEISLYCDDCDLDFTDDYDVYADYMGSMIDYAHDMMEDR